MRRALALLVLGSAIAACSGPGASASPAASAIAISSAESTVAPSPGAAASMATTEPSAAQSEAAVSSQPFSLSSPAFAAGAAIPARHTCDEADVSPPLAWVGAPAGTESLVLTVHDPDARNFVHWVAYDIPAAPSGSLPEAIARSASSPKQGRNDFGRDGYGGPCPPSGTHHYVFALSALDRTLGLGGGKTAADVQAAMKGHVLATAELTGTYKRR